MGIEQSIKVKLVGQIENYGDDAILKVTDWNSGMYSDLAIGTITELQSVTEHRVEDCRDYWFESSPLPDGETDGEHSSRCVIFRGKQKPIIVAHDIVQVRTLIDNAKNQ